MNLPRLNRDGALYLVAFISCIPIANWMIGNVGTKCVPNGPCLVPVWPGIMAPSGVLMIGFALVLRDLVQRRLGGSWALLAIGVGALVSGVVAQPALVLASVAAFTLSEVADFAVYTPLQKRRLILAVILSSVAGLVLDSVVFIFIAFGSLEFLYGQIIGKLWAVGIALLFLIGARRRNLIS
jgi:uncharacterized PurR-regulated membrane protein YhhQ (DUF165 family)